MSSDREIEDRLVRIGRKVASRPPLAADVMRKVEALPANPAGDGRRAVPGSGRPEVWRRLLRPRWIAAAAAAAAVLVATALSWHFVLGSGTPLTLAQVRAAMDEVLWVHVRYDNGQVEESWYSLADGKSYTRHRDGDVVYCDHARNVRLWWWKGSDVIQQDEPAVYPDGKIPPWKPKSAWELSVGWREERYPLSDEAATGPRLEKHEETLDGRRMVRFDVYRVNALDEVYLASQMWADPETRLPVKVRDRLQPQPRFRKTRNQQWQEGLYDFPLSGPGSIHDLGVPRNLRVVQSDKPNESDAVAVFALAQQAWRRFPECYRAVVVWRMDGPVADRPDAVPPREVEVIYCDGSKRRRDRYLGFSLPGPVTAERVIEWTAGKDVFDVVLEDGQKSYYWSSNQGRPTCSVSHNMERQRLGRRSTSRLQVPNDPFEFLWPIHVYGRFGMKLNLVVALDPDEPVDGCIVLRHGERTPGEQGGYWDYYLDPSRDYICVKQVYFIGGRGTQHGAAKLVETLDGLYQLPGGQWCASRRIRTDHFTDADAPLATRTLTWTVDVKVLTESELPPGVFDGQKLLEGAEVTASN